MNPARRPSTAHASLVPPHGRSLLAQARRLTRNEADAHDLVQDTMVRALEALRQTREPPANVRAWLRVVMRRHWLNVLRHRRVQHGAAGEIACDAMDACLVTTRASFAQVERAWRDLPTSARQIAEQCLLRDEPYEDVAARAGVAKATVATSIHRTRLHLRSALFGA